MKITVVQRWLPAALLVLMPLLISGPAVAQEEARIVTGETADAYGAQVSTWARVSESGEVREVGVSIPRATMENAPAEAPPGARMGQPAMHPRVALIQFPEPVRETTWFEYFELNWNPEGHPPGVYSPPHFDFHFYGRPYSEVRTIDCSYAARPPEELMPEGFMVPWDDPMNCAPEMGYHAVSPQGLEEPFTAVMVAGIYWGEMTFLEPMATREFMLREQSFSLEVPRPERLARAARYPRQFHARYLSGPETWELVFSNFEEVPGLEAPPIADTDAGSDS